MLRTGGLRRWRGLGYAVAMRGVWAIGLYVVCVFAGAGLLSPVVWWGAHAAAEAIPGVPGLVWVDHPFSRYVHRCLLGLAVVGLLPLTRALGLRTWQEVGFGKVPGRGRRVWMGVIAAWVGCSVLVVWEILSGTRVWKEGMSLGKVFAGLFQAGASGVVVAVIEEAVFRGVLWKGLQSSLGGGASVVVSSVIYALSHFLGRPEMGGEIGWGSGFEMLIRMLAGEGSKAAWIPGVLTLFLLGVLFSLSFWREGTLYFAMGVHGGVVVWGKLRAVLTRTREGVSVSSDPLSGWVTFGLAIAAIWVYGVWQGREGKKFGRVLVRNETN